MKRFLFALMVVTCVKTTAQTNFNFGDQSAIPKFKEGPEKLFKYFKENKIDIDDPLPPNKQGNQVLIEYTVDTAGVTKNIKIIEGLGEPFDSEAIRLYSNFVSS